MFRGASSLNLDAKGRLGIPSRFRDVLAERCDGRVVLTVNNTRERCLWLYPLDEWDTVERKVAELPSFDSTSQELKRFLIGYATDCELDSAGTDPCISTTTRICRPGKAGCADWPAKQI